MLLSQLEYIVEIVQCGSMNKAAEKLFVSQPNLSKSVRRLEEELGFSIFKRSRQQLKLTEDGKKVYYYAKSMLGEMESIRKVKDLKVANYHILYVATGHMLMGAELMSEYYAKTKPQSMSLSLQEGNLEEVINKVKAYEAEIGIVSYCNILKKQFFDGLSKKNLEYHKLQEEPVCVMLGPLNPYYTSEFIPVEEMPQFPIIKSPDDGYTITQSGKVFGNVRASSFKKIITVNSVGLALECIRKTDAIKISGPWNGKDYERQGLRLVPISNIEATMNLGYIIRKNEQLSEEAKLLIELMGHQ